MVGRRLWKFVLVLACAAPLGACGNFVGSKTPLFTAADEVGAVPLKPGVWIAREPDCVSDDSKPIAEWPSCAAGMVLDRQGLKSPGLDLKIDRVAAGDPMIVQLGAANGDGYFYVAAEVKARDSRGRATSVVWWSVLCSLEGFRPSAGPQPAEAQAADTNAPPTDPSATAPPSSEPPPRELFPGLTPDGKDCLANDAATVRNAAAFSKPIASPIEARWLRARDR